MAENSRPTAFVTGASYGVGQATALALAHAGYDLAISATRTRNLGETTAVHDIVAAFGGIDLLVNNAGTNLRARAVDVTPAEWDDMIAVNVTGTFHLTQLVGRHLIENGRGGSIVSIASTHALIGAPERST